jgi:hypothetical protein
LILHCTATPALRAAPTGLCPVGRLILHYIATPALRAAPTGLCPVGRLILHYAATAPCCRIRQSAAKHIHSRAPSSGVGNRSSVPGS